MTDAYRWLGPVPPGAEKIRARRRDREDKLALMKRWGLRADGTRADAEDSAEAQRKPAQVLSLVPDRSPEPPPASRCCAAPRLVEWKLLSEDSAGWACNSCGATGQMPPGSAIEATPLPASGHTAERPQVSGSDCEGSPQ